MVVYKYENIHYKTNLEFSETHLTSANWITNKNANLFSKPNLQKTTRILHP